MGKKTEVIFIVTYQSHLNLLLVVGVVGKTLNFCLGLP